jgi:hypothetical protein
MSDEHKAAVEALIRTFDVRLSALPLVDRRSRPRPDLIEASRSPGPVERDFAFWASSEGNQRSAGPIRVRRGRR